jgi:hypothetical protein
VGRKLCLGELNLGVLVRSLSRLGFVGLLRFHVPFAGARAFMAEYTRDSWFASAGWQEKQIVRPEMNPFTGVSHANACPHSD